MLDLVLQPAMFASDNTELDTQNLVLWPGRVIKIHGDTSEAQIRPLQWDMSGYPMVQAEVESISRYIDMGTGIQRDTIQGMSTGNEQTAREFVGRMEQARTRLGVETMLFEKEIIEPLAEDYMKMNRLLLPIPKQISLIGSAAIIDPDLGIPLPQEQMFVDLNDLNGDHQIQATGGSNMMSKTMLRQDMITTMTAMQSNPFALQLTNWVSFFNRFWKAFDLDPREMMITGIPPLMNEMASQMSMSPEQQGGYQGDSLEAMSATDDGSQSPRSTLGPMSNTSGSQNRGQ